MVFASIPLIIGVRSVEKKFPFANGKFINNHNGSLFPSWLSLKSCDFL